MRLKRRSITGIFMGLLIVVVLMLTSFGDKSVKAQESGEAKENGEASGDLKEDLEPSPSHAADAKSSDAEDGVGDASPGSDAGVSEGSLDDSLLPAGLISNIHRERKRLAVERADIEQARKDLKIAQESLRTQLKDIDARIDDRIKELKALRDQVAALKSALTKAQSDHVEGQRREKVEAHETKITHLVKLCERMPPESAAPYLEGLEVDVAAAVLSRMRVRKAAAVIAAMRSSKAADLSKRYLQDDIPPAPGIAPKPTSQ
jgi:flagellar motility protein MotE (MotC chaperone)